MFKQSLFPETQQTWIYIAALEENFVDMISHDIHCNITNKNVKSFLYSDLSVCLKLFYVKRIATGFL